MATDIRLRCREAHEVHQRVIDFEHSYSPTGIPSRATGLDPFILKVMRWALEDFSRLSRLNALLGTGAAQLEMDVLPGVMCGAHFMIAFRTPPPREERGEALLRAGESIQRFWLEATRLGLSMQPGNAPLIFGTYGERDQSFTQSKILQAQARKLAKCVRDTSGGIPASALIFAGRVGFPRTPKTGPRSVRRSLEELMLKNVVDEHAIEKGRVLELAEDR
jgi:hypothetical protein